MAIQVIIYSVATGRVRRVEDPLIVVANAIAYLNQVPTSTGEARLLYTKKGGGQDTAASWQAAVNTATGLSVDFPVDSTATDWYCGIDNNNLIQWWGIADPACGDTLPSLTLVNAPFPANNAWTYNGTTFTAPVTGTVKPGAV